MGAWRALFRGLFLGARCVLWSVAAALVLLLIYSYIILPTYPDEGTVTRLGRAWDAEIAWLDIEIFHRQQLGAQRIVFDVDPGCQTVFGRIAFRAIVKCTAACLDLPLPPCRL